MIIYQPYQSPVIGSRETTLNFLKMPNPSFAKSSHTTSYGEDEQSSREPMRAIEDLCGYSTVFLPGDFPTFIIKTALSPPQLISMCETSVQSLSRLNTSNCQRGFVYVDQQVS